MFVIFLGHIIFRKPKFVYKEERTSDEPVIILSNHVGKKVPTKLGIYYSHPKAFWGTHEMNEGFRANHRYLRKVFYHEKKHLPRWLSFIVASIVAPFTNTFYKGEDIISTYQDLRFMQTLKESYRAFEEGKDIIIFPEDSSAGYEQELTKFFSGFAHLLEFLNRKGKDVSIYVTFYQKKKNTFLFSEKISYSKLKESYSDFDSIAEEIRRIMNQLGEESLNK